MTWVEQPPYADGSVLRVTDMNGIRGNLNDTAGRPSLCGRRYVPRHWAERHCSPCARH